jgi:thiosulfate/3-mercaptopyruvate sulfurtransferase
MASAAGLTLAVTGCRREEQAADIVINDPAYPDASVFVTPDQLAGTIDDPNLIVLDCSKLSTYRRGHVPGARHVWWQDTIEVHNPVYGMLVNAEGRAALVRSTGIHPESRVVCYDADGGVYAARIAWTLRYMGFRNTSILLGGTEGWRAAGYDLTRQQPNGTSGSIPDIFDESIIAHPQDVVARLDEPGLVFLDTRTTPERGETWNNRLREGQIPGSAWLPRNEWLDEHSVPLDAAELETLLETVLEPETTAEIIVYGLHGTLACLPYYMVLALNRYHVRLYDGSWSQWGSDHSLPVEPLQS